MKVPYKISIIFSLTLLLLSCKQEVEKDNSTDNTSSEKAEITNVSDAFENKEVTQKKELSIEEFLIELQNAVKQNDITTIEKSIKFPFEYQSGGESSFYENITRLLRNPHFKKITKAKFEKVENNNMYSILYEQSDNEDFFIYYYAIKVDSEFKLIKLEMPH